MVVAMLYACVILAWNVRFVPVPLLLVENILAHEVHKSGILNPSKLIKFNTTVNLYSIV